MAISQKDRFGRYCFVAYNVLYFDETVQKITHLENQGSTIKSLFAKLRGRQDISRMRIEMEKEKLQYDQDNVPTK